MPIYGLKFGSPGQTAYYTATCDLREGDGVLVETEQGPVFGLVVTVPLETVPRADGASCGDAPLPRILRPADAQDWEKERQNRELAREAAVFCRRGIASRQLDMKLVGVEVFFDRGKLIFYFTAPSRIDFRDLVKELVQEYHTRIELRQIGVRHETQMVGALGNCGMVCCCRRYLRKFASVTIRMAKEQDLFLNPAKISGICGRLLCCLSYEQENYDSFHKSCPKLGKRYQTSQGYMKVLRTNMFRNSLVALTENNEEREFTLEEWQTLSPRRAEVFAVPAQAPRPAPDPGLPDNSLMVFSASPDSLNTLDTMDTLDALETLEAIEELEGVPAAPAPPDRAEAAPFVQSAPAAPSALSGGENRGCQPRKCKHSRR